MDAGTVKKLIEKNLRYDEVRRLLVKLAQAPSPQTDLLEAEPQVLSLIRDVVQPELERSAVRTSFDAKGNLVASFKGRAQGRRLLLVGYAMNAAPSTMKNPYSGALVDGTPFGLSGECVWGRGACEQKCSLAAMMAAIKFLGEAKAEIPADLFFAVSAAGETGRHDSLAHIMAEGNVKADWAIVDGPPEIQLGNKGRVDIEIVVRGKQAHSSRPWDGVNAIDGAVKVLERLKPLMPYPSERTHPELGRVSLTPTAIESFPKATHTIQSECRIMFDRRLLPGDDPTKAVEQIKAALGTAPPFDVEVRQKDFMYPSEVSKDADVVLALAQAIQVMLGRDAKYSYSTAANDTGFLNAKGIQAINYGARNVRFQHTDHDLVEVESVFEAARVFAFMGLHR